MRNERIILYDNSPTKSSPVDPAMFAVVGTLMGIGVLSMLSYWLMIEVYNVWQHPLTHVGYTLFITAAFVLLHAAILAGFIWLAMAALGLLIAIVEAVCMSFIAMWRIGQVIYDKAWHIAHAFRNFSRDIYSRISKK